MSEYRERSRRRSSGPRQIKSSQREKINWAQLRLGLIRQCKGTGEWAHIHFRRWVHVLHSESGGRWTVGPASFLGVSAALGLALTITTLYSSSYAVTVDGERWAWWPTRISYPPPFRRWRRRDPPAGL